MKLSLLKKESSPAAIIAAASIACLGLAQQAEAGVTWLASDDGTNLTLTTSGSLTGVPIANSNWGTGPNFARYNSSTKELWGFTGAVTQYRSNGIGFTTSNNPWIVTGDIIDTDGASGHSFGHVGDALLGDNAFSGSTFTPVSTLVFSGLTVSTAFGTNLDAGPVVVWALNGEGGDTISVALVPEPSSTALLGLGGLALMLRRRR